MINVLLIPKSVEEKAADAAASFVKARVHHPVKSKISRGRRDPQTSRNNRCPIKRIEQHAIASDQDHCKEAFPWNDVEVPHRGSALASCQDPFDRAQPPEACTDCFAFA